MKYFLISIILIPFFTNAQNLSGVWEGSGNGVTSIKLVITQRGDSLTGYTHDTGGGYCTASFEGVFNKNTQKLKGRNIHMIENSGTHGPAKYNWTYTKEADGEYLREKASLLELLLGLETDQWLKKVSNKPELLKTENTISPKIEEEKKPDPVKEKPVPVKVKKQQPPVKKEAVLKDKKVIPPIPKSLDTVTSKPETVVNRNSILVNFKKQRTSKIIQTIKTKSDSIRILLFDNGTIDNDTVTVFYNNKVVLEKYMITASAKELKLPVEKKSENLIELFANNLGTIPPNTALLIIYAGEKRYELHTSYDLKNNAAIIVEYDSGQ